jgi:hypothetical protein
VSFPSPQCGKRPIRLTWRLCSIWTCMFISSNPVVNPVDLSQAWGYPWDNESLQHVFVGILSFIGALLGAMLSEYPHGRSKRNVLPGIVRCPSFQSSGISLMTNKGRSHSRLLVHCASPKRQQYCGVLACRVRLSYSEYRCDQSP